MNKFLISASALVFAAAISGAAMAGTGNGNDTKAIDGSTATTNVSTSSTEANPTSITKNTSLSNSDNTSITKTTSLSNSDNTSVSLTKNIDSGNTKLIDSGNTKNIDSGNTKNVSVSTTENTSIDKSQTNSHNSSLSLVFSGPLTLQTLDADVDDHAAASQGSSGSVSLSGGSSASFAGVQTMSVNTGLQNVNQAATAVSATSNVTF
jgi:hypothetical protein